jgi:alkylated DNA repair protein alkB family protein 7
MRRGRTFSSYAHRFIDSNLGCTVHWEKFGVAVFPSFFTLDEEKALDSDASHELRKQPWEAGHWDNVIKNYREIQRPLLSLSAASRCVVERAHAHFPSGNLPLPTYHALELAPGGEILPHVDSIKFSGSVVAGLCLRSTAVLELTPDVGAIEEGRAPTATEAGVKEPKVSILLPQGTLYILTGEARYGWGHAIPPGSPLFKGNIVTRKERLSIMLRDELLSHYTASTLSPMVQP